MKKLIFSFILLTGFAIAANAQSNSNITSGGTQVQAVSESADVPAETPAQVSESNSNDASSKANSGMTGKKKSCCAHGKKASANCGDMKKEEKTSEEL